MKFLLITTFLLTACLSYSQEEDDSVLGGSGEVLRELIKRIPASKNSPSIINVSSISLATQQCRSLEGEIQASYKVSKLCSHFICAKDYESFSNQEVISAFKFCEAKGNREISSAKKTVNCTQSDSKVFCDDKTYVLEDKLDKKLDSDLKDHPKHSSEKSSAQ